MNNVSMMTNKLILLALSVLCFSCEAKLKEGVVIDKVYEEGRDVLRFEYDAIYKRWMPKTRWDDEDFILIVKCFNGKDTVQQRFEVPKDYYENTNIGDTIVFN